MIATVTHAVELVLVFVPNVFPPMFLQAESVLPLVPLKIAPLAVVPAQQPAPSVILDSSLKAVHVKPSLPTPALNLLQPSDTRWL